MSFISYPFIYYFHTCIPHNIAVTVRNELPYNSTIFMSMKTHYYGRSATIRNKTDICSYSNFGVVDDSDGSFYSQSYNGNVDNNDDDDEGGGSSSSNSFCPIRTGMHYMLLTSFTVQEVSSRNSNWGFTPDLTMAFFLSTDEFSPLIGCVETGTKAQNALNLKRSKNGVLALFLSISSFVTVFALCLHNQGQRRRAVELLENNRVASMVRRYHYRRSNTAGSGSMGTGLAPVLEDETCSDGSGGGGNNSNFDPTTRNSTASRDPPPPWG